MHPILGTGQSLSPTLQVLEGFSLLKEPVHHCLFRSSNGDWGRVLKFSFNQKLESITRKMILKLDSVPSLRFCR